MAQVNYDSETGETYIVQQRSGYDGSKPHNQQDYYEDNYGNTRHRFENVVLNEELEDDPVRSDYESWRTETYIELYGGPERYNQMVSYAEANWDQTDIDAFNSVMDSDDPQKIEEALAHLNEMFTEHSLEGSVPNETKDDDVDEPTDDVEWFMSLDDEVLESTVDDLLDTSLTPEQDSQMASLQTQYEPESAQYEILAVGQQVAAGHLEMSDAIEMVIDSFGEATAARAYFELQNILSNYY